MRDAPHTHRSKHTHVGLAHDITPYSSRYNSKTALTKHKIPKDGAPADAVYQMLKDELDLDGRPNLNLASFVGTYMERQAEQLMIENLSKNMSDVDEYPAMMDMHARCVSIIADLWGAGKHGERAIGTATTGSSEAIQLGGLAMKRRWQEKRMKEGKDYSKPNIIMGANAQVALEKFARYFEVEGRILPVSTGSSYRLDPKLVKENLDENTIGVFVILGSTYTGHYEPVEEISNLLDEFEKETGHDVPIHVDGASGGFIAPFAYAGAGFKWDFTLPRVKSINVSGHKFGLVYAGVGWIIWRDESMLPKHLVFELHYLGGTEESYTLNFSRPGAQIIAQYFLLEHLGFNGYRSIMEGALANARLLSRALEATGWYRCVSDIHRRKGIYHYEPNVEAWCDSERSDAYNAGLPVVAFTFSDEFKKEHPDIKQVSVSNLLRAKQYIVPNYPLPPDEEGTEILRVVVRESHTLDLIDRLIADICVVTQALIDNQVSNINAWQPLNAAGNSIEKIHSSLGVQDTSEAHRPMDQGVHRAVC